ncbi:hypothetical protein WOLCODRAFT_159173 [Wolfiporia cocos MD-104 SS10]|uniref:Uncharacterized protein n=1 Tax=Wolfiporia cocos (strain MD-104) TaxID=742152 RepID=A0A2H3JI99_WOLCO|nr:hypothetical protein WOLCODRAFT_159173 [Wolfiporia cocos MD-104 SS10]
MILALLTSDQASLGEVAACLARARAGVTATTISYEACLLALPHLSADYVSAWPQLLHRCIYALPALS